MIPIPLIMTMIATSNIMRNHAISSLHNEIQKNNQQNTQNNEMLLLMGKKGFKMTINQNETIEMYRLFGTFDYGIKWEALDSSNNVICSSKTLPRCIEKLVSKINPVEIECMPTLIDNGHIREFAIMVKTSHE